MDVQQMMIDEQSRVIMDMSVKMENNQIDNFEKVTELKEAKHLIDTSVNNVEDYDNIPTVSPCTV